MRGTSDPNRPRAAVAIAVWLTADVTRIGASSFATARGLFGQDVPLILMY